MCIRDRSGLGGRAVGLARQLHPAGKALEHVVVPGLLLPRAGHAESGQRDTDDRRVEMLEVIVSDADLRRHVASQVRVDDVGDLDAVSYTHLRAHETDSYLVCRLLLEKKK